MKTLFVSTDLSAAGNNAVKYAAHYSQDIECNLVIFHAVHLPTFKATIEEEDLLRLKKDTEAEQAKSLDVVVDQIYQDMGLNRNRERVRVATRIEAFAADAILEAAEECHADVIIVGTHGATGMKLLGSITSEVIFKAETPVLAVPPQCMYKKIETVVYATDFKNTVNELRAIVPFASRMKAVIEVLNVGLGTSDEVPVLDEKNLIKEMKYDRIKVVIQKEIKGMSMLDQLETYLEKRKPEVLVMFPEERSIIDKIFVRSKTEELAYHAKLPLLTYLKSIVGR